jgi:hypothetical protein
MQNPFAHFWLFAYAVWDHAFTLAAGCVVTVVINLIEKYAMKGKKLSLKLDIAILLTFLFFACFQAWRDQYDRATSTATAPTIQVNVPQQPPAQVNVPAPIVNFPSEQAYISSSETRIFSDYYKINGQWAISDNCKNLSRSVVAEDAVCIPWMTSADTDFNSMHQAIVSKGNEDKAYAEFEKSYKIQAKAMSRRAYGPEENTWSTAFLPVDEKQDAAFRATSKTIIFFARYDWKDGHGHHSNETCKWLQMYPGFFTGPGVIAPSANVTFHYCQGHNGPVSR